MGTAGMSDFVAIDFETTGVVEGWADEPWQIGMVRIRGGVVRADEVFERLLRIGDRPFNRYAPGGHQRVRQRLAVAPTMAEIWPDLRRWWVGAPMVAHNAATERKFVQAAAPLHRPGPWVDTLALARSVYPDLPSYALGDLLERFSLLEEIEALCPGRALHDALFDAVGCARLLTFLLTQAGWGRLSVGDLSAVGGGAGRGR